MTISSYGKVWSYHDHSVKDQLFKWAWPKIQRTASCGLPQWYKRMLSGMEAPV